MEKQSRCVRVLTRLPWEGCGGGTGKATITCTYVLISSARSRVTPKPHCSERSCPSAWGHTAFFGWKRGQSVGPAVGGQTSSGAIESSKSYHKPCVEQLRHSTPDCLVGPSSEGDLPHLQFLISFFVKFQIQPCHPSFIERLTLCLGYDCCTGLRCEYFRCEPQFQVPCSRDEVPMLVRAYTGIFASLCFFQPSPLSSGSRTLVIFYFSVLVWASVRTTHSLLRASWTVSSTLRGPNKTSAHIPYNCCPSVPYHTGTLVLRKRVSGQDKKEKSQPKDKEFRIVPAGKKLR